MNKSFVVIQHNIALKALIKYIENNTDSKNSQIKKDKKEKINYLIIKKKTNLIFGIDLYFLFNNIQF